jgi:hypothetical protein
MIRFQTISTPAKDLEIRTNSIFFWSVLRALAQSHQTSLATTYGKLIVISKSPLKRILADPTMRQRVFRSVAVSEKAFYALLSITEERH